MNNTSNGKLIYVIGPPCSGKESLIKYARRKLVGNPSVLVAHRYITKPMAVDAENHIALLPEEFEPRLAAGLFAMHWESHGNQYAIGMEINHWLCKGMTVLIKGSRGYLPRAMVKYPELLPVFIDVVPEVLRQRCAANGLPFSDEGDIHHQRNRGLYTRPSHAVAIDNSGLLNEAGDKLVNMIERHTKTQNAFNMASII